ncbi:TFP11-domain-containing protein [Panus rudis PR-1116 ss-1]|nr:TFP11-domain-containing protein [Panus rudis PR-1116 ss-1]
MARRKRQLLEDDDSDSSISDEQDYNDPNYDPNDPDAREERALFENPYGHKRRRKNGKEDAIYGVFADSDEDEGFGGKEKAPKKRTDWTKAPAFVSGDKVDLDKEMDVDGEEGDKDDKESNNEEMSTDDEDEESKPASPRVRDEDEDEAEEQERPRFGGIGSKSTSEPSNGFVGFSKGGIGSGAGGIGSSKGGIGSGKGGIGSGKGGIGSGNGGIGSAFRPSTTTSTSETPPPSTSRPRSPSPSPPLPENLPSAFGRSRPQRSFLRDDTGSDSQRRSATPLSAQERAHFSKLSGSFGARMLEKMGWQAGMGLGTSGEGIVTPVESKLRPKGMGLAFKGFTEKTAQSKAEARRRGEVVSDDEEEFKPKSKKAQAKAQKERSEAWKKPKKTRKKVEHKTYEEILAEAGHEAPSGVGQIIDATGATPREVSSLADVAKASWTPTADPTRLPELRHNLRLITEACKSDLDGLAREAKALEERKRWVKQEDERLRKQVEEEAELISRLQQVHLVVDDINSQAKEIAQTYEASLEPFSPNFDKLVGQFAKEFDRYRLDEIVIAAIAPVVRRMLAQWNPLEDPSEFTKNFRLWRRALKMTVPEETNDAQVQVYGSSTVITSSSPVEKPMTPYESLIWNAWLPKVRTAINNDWNPEDPHPAVRLYEAWSSLLPPFVRDNFFDQLVLPKVHKAVSDWNPRKHRVPLQTLVFPWLPHVGLRVEDVLGDARRKVKSLLRGWAVSDGMPEDIMVWKEVFNSGDWDTMLLKYVVPKLGARLREDFRVNPRQQDMEPLQDILLWEHALRPSILSQLLETEFFPKWLDVLHIWLIQPKPSFAEVSQWYQFWKSSFSENVQAMPGVAQGFTRGLQLMNKAIELGPDAPTRLPRPEHHPPVSISPSTTPKSTSRQTTPKPRPSRTQEITFRSIVEDFAASHNLLFVPTGRAHEKSRMPLFRVSQTVDGKGGLLVYIADDAVWAPDGDEYRAISLENMVLRATKGG